MNVTYLDHMGSDLAVVNAARVSFSKQSDWEYHCDKCGVVEGIYDGWECEVDCPLTNRLKDKDIKLINYLAKEGHYLPFRHPHVSFHCKAPIFVARQAGKHQVGMDWSEVSRRYVDTEPEFYTPEVWRKKADDKKQGSSNNIIKLPEDGYWGKGYTRIDDWWTDVNRLYEWLLEQGVAPEQARMVLPQSMYTEWVWTGSLLSWHHFVKLRTDSHAQKEIQDFANMFVPTLEQLYPVSWKALMP